MTILVSSPCSCHSRDTSSSDSSSGERAGARLISVLFSFRMSLDSSDDDSQVEDDLAGKNKSKLKPCKTTLPADYVPHGTYGYSYPGHLYSRFLWLARSLVPPWSTFAHFDTGDSSDDSDDISYMKLQVANRKGSQRDSSKTLSSADDVESDESIDETSSDSSDEPDVDTDSNSVLTSKGSGSKKTVSRATKPATSSSDVTSSSSSDSSSDEEEELPSVLKQKTKSTSSSDSSSGSGSDSDEDSKLATTNKLKRKTASSSSSDSSSGDDTSEESSSSSSSSSKTSSSPESEDELEETPTLSVKPDPEARATKKRRANEEGKAVVIATKTTVTTLVGNARGGKTSRKPNAPFQRVKVDPVKYFDEKLKNNSFESRVCPVPRALLDETVLNAS